jgi:hypothetical protein
MNEKSEHEKSIKFSQLWDFKELNKKKLNVEI